MAEELIATSINGYELTIEIQAKQIMLRDPALSRSVLWLEIKSIRRADPQGGIIPLSRRIVAYESAEKMIDELQLYHKFMSDSLNQNANDDDANNNNDNNNNNNNNGINGAIDNNNNNQPENNHEMEVEVEETPIRLLLQISSPDNWIVGEMIARWLQENEGNEVPHSLVKNLHSFLESWFKKFSSSLGYQLSLECRPYNEMVRKHIPSKFDPSTDTVSNWLGNQQKVIKKKAASITKSLGTLHILIALDFQRYLRNDAPRNVEYRIGYIGPHRECFDVMYAELEEYQQAKERFEIELGAFFGTIIELKKSSKNTRLELIAQEMSALESNMAEEQVEEIEYLRQMDKLRKERGLLLEQENNQ